MAVKIKTLDIKSLRGIVDMHLDIEKKHLVIKGENGTGKSSIIDAIEFFFTGKISHLEGVQGLSLQRHCPHVKNGFDSTEVKITFLPDNCSLTRNSSSLSSIPENLSSYFDTAKQGTFILRRAQLLEFILSKPSDRFRAIGNIIGIDDLDSIELDMKRVRDEATGLVESTNKKIESIKTNIFPILETPVNTIEDVITKINELFTKYKIPRITSIEEVDKHTEDMLKDIKSKSELNDASRIHHQLAAVSESLLIDESSINDINELITYNHKLIEENIKEKISYAEFLELGKAIISPDNSICPFCEQGIIIDSIQESVNLRLKAFSQISDKASSTRTLSAKLVDLFKTKISQIQLFYEQNKTSYDNDIKIKIEAILTSLNEIITIIADPVIFEKKLDKPSVCAKIDEVNKNLKFIHLKSLEIYTKSNLSEADKQFLLDIRIVEQLKIKLKEWNLYTLELIKHKKTHTVAEAIFDSFSESKRSKVQKIYSSIESDIDSYYSMIHPGESHKNIKLNLTGGRRASTELKMSSFDREEDPRGLASEGHLDSLGLCIFLAFIENFNDNCPLVLLDDVISTVDAKHRTKICKLLLTKFSEKQLIITTHDNFWYEQITSFQRAHKIESEFLNLRIVNWSLDGGPVIKPYVPRWEMIQEKISDGDKSGGGNEGRKYFRMGFGKNMFNN
jgi:recombinational DNA repair ATPase RecF